MSALSRPNFAAGNVLIDLRDYVAIEEACRLLQMSDRHLRRLCTHTLQRRGLAVFCRPESGGGKARWFVARKYDLKLARGAMGAVQQIPSLEGFSKKQVDIAWRRVACVESLREARSSWKGTQQQWLPALIEQLRVQHPELSISAPTLLRWYALYDHPADVLKLIDKRGGNTRGQADPACWAEFRKLYLDERCRSVRSCWEEVKEWAGPQKLTWVSYKACTRALDEHVPPELAAKHRKPVVYRHSFAPYIQQDPEAWPAGQCWLGDHSQLDLWCRAGDQVIRPWLTAWMDWRTRRLVGWTLNTGPNSSTILAALRAGLLDDQNYGGPGVVWIDNGKDYDCWALQGQTKAERRKRIKLSVDEHATAGLFNLLGIEVHFSMAYNPNGKGRLERWFGTLHDQFDRTFATYCGNSPANRPEGLNELLKNKPHAIPSFDHVRSRLVEFLRGYNASAQHSKADLDGRSPDQAMAEWVPTRRILPPPQTLDMLLQQWHKPQRVGRNGLTISVAGMALSYGQYEPALSRFKGTGENLHISYDPNDVSQIRVYDAQWRFIAVADLNDTGGMHDGSPISREHVSRILARQRAYNRALDQVEKTRHVEYMSTAELLAREASPLPVLPPAEGSLQIVRTPLDHQPLELPQRKAAGAELVDLGDLDLSRLDKPRDATPTLDLTLPPASASDAQAVIPPSPAGDHRMDALDLPEPIQIPGTPDDDQELDIIEELMP